MIKRILATLLAITMLCVCIPFVSAYNLSNKCTVVKQSDVYADKTCAFDTESNAMLVDHLYGAFFNYEREVDVSSFYIPSTTDSINGLAMMIYDEMPLAFFVAYINVWHSNGYITKIEPAYSYEKSVSLEMVAQYKYEAERLVADLKGNNAVSDLDKALLLHDRIAVMCEFDLGDETGSVDDEAFNGYGVFLKRKAVCHGYSEAYDYLLELVGIKSELCRSVALNHTWNIITINGKEYHVDITWDDSIWGATRWDVIGKIDHRYFMVSSTKLYPSHAATDYDTSPTDTTYDNYYWRDIQSAFQLVDNKLYYIDQKNANLVCKTDEKVVRSVKDIWYASADSYWPKNYSYLGSNGQVLFFSQADAIVEYNPRTDVMRTVHTPDLSVGEYYYVYGFAYIDGYFIYDINNSPNFGVPTMYRVKVQHDKTLPTVSITAGNDCADKQVVSIELADDVGIKGYYFGESPNVELNTYKVCTTIKVQETISAEGTYYIYAVDVSGNVSEAKSVTYYKTVLSGNGGVVTPSYVLTPAGEIPSLPIPKNEICGFLGWYTAKNNGVEASQKAVTSNQTLYAMWKGEAKLGDVNEDSVIDNIDAVIILKYDSGILDASDTLLTLGDTNKDGVVDNLDASMILKYDAGIIEGF